MEYWEARELMPLLEYSKWGNFHQVIKRAMLACESSNNSVFNHFPEFRKMVEIGSKTKRETIDYISLTDLARYKNSNNLGDVIIKWMSNKSSFDFYCLWEELFNEDFKLVQSSEFKNDLANQSFTMSPSSWISMEMLKVLLSNDKNIVGIKKLDKKNEEMIKNG